MKLEVSPMSQRTILTNGAALQVTETGDGAPALLFLHYWGGSSRTWREVIARFGGWPRSIALDQRGWGGSIATDGRYDLSTDAVHLAIGMTNALRMRSIIMPQALRMGDD
jgi:pimeloyl-ACP methyl ester carboxylesterase